MSRVSNFLSTARKAVNGNRIDNARSASSRASATIGGASRQNIKNGDFDGVIDELGKKGNRMLAGTEKAGLIQKTEKKMSNFNTGYQENGTLIGIAGAISVAGVGKSTLNSNYTMQDRSLNRENVGSAPIHTYDGSAPKSKAPTMGASGDVVLGMHRGR